MGYDSRCNQGILRNFILGLHFKFCCPLEIESFSSQNVHVSSFTYSYSRLSILIFMIRSGFCASSFILLLFLVVDPENSIICDGESAYVKRHPFCIAQSVILMFSFLWTEIWAACQAFHLYLIVVLRLRREVLNVYEKRFIF